MTVLEMMAILNHLIQEDPDAVNWIVLMELNGDCGDAEVRKVTDGWMMSIGPKKGSKAIRIESDA